LYDEIQRKLCPGFDPFGRNLDALIDILRGGFGLDTPLTLRISGRTQAARAIDRWHKFQEIFDEAPQGRYGEAVKSVAWLDGEGVEKQATDPDGEGGTEVELDFSAAKSESDLYDEIQRKLCPGFDEFGRNLHALEDILCGGFGLETPFSLRIRGCEEAARASSMWIMFREIFEDAEEVRSIEWLDSSA